MQVKNDGLEEIEMNERSYRRLIMETYELYQAWLLFYVTTTWWIRAIGLLAAFWIFMQLLPNTWAGGKLFDRGYAWISSALATIIAFIVFVFPWISRQLLSGLFLFALLVLLTLFAKRQWKPEKHDQNENKKEDNEKESEESEKEK